MKIHSSLNSNLLLWKKLVITLCFLWESSSLSKLRFNSFNDFNIDSPNFEKRLKSSRTCKASLASSIFYLLTASFYTPWKWQKISILLRFNSCCSKPSFVVFIDLFFVFFPRWQGVLGNFKHTSNVLVRSAFLKLFKSFVLNFVRLINTSLLRWIRHHD